MEKVFITLAIHTYDYAVGLRRVLEKNGIATELENVNIDNPKLASGVRVRIAQDDLPLALRLVENPELFSPSLPSGKRASKKPKVLVPVDFSDYSFTAAKVAFAYADLLDLQPVLLHVYATPYFDGNLGNTDTFTLERSDIQVRKDLKASANIEMNHFIKRIKQAVADGDIPDLHFAHEIFEGVPEEAILNYANSNLPALIVMGTRGSHKKAQDMVGSVTAEVLDSSAFPIFTVPEKFEFSSLEHFDNVAFFCNIDQHDLLAMDSFIRINNAKPMNITIIPVNDRVGSKLKGRVEALYNYFTSHYPAQQFSVADLGQNDLKNTIQQLIESGHVKMLVIPNKKKNIFARLFNPSIAHKILFERDIPMLALPV